MALYCISLSFLRGYERGVLLKNHKERLYSTIGRMHVLYRSYFWWGRSSLVEFSSIFIYLTINNALLEEKLMCCWKDSFLSKIKPSRGLRSRGGGLKILCNLEKWKTLDFLCSIMSPNWLSRDKIIL